MPWGADALTRPESTQRFQKARLSAATQRLRAPHVARTRGATCARDLDKASWSNGSWVRRISGRMARSKRQSLGPSCQVALGPHSPWAERMDGGDAGWVHSGSARDGVHSQLQPAPPASEARRRGRTRHAPPGDQPHHIRQPAAAWSRACRKRRQGGLRRIIPARLSIA
jgi:hypothetical protein